MEPGPTARRTSRSSSRWPASISPRNPKPNSAMPLITRTSMRLSSGRKPMPKPKRTTSATMPAREPAAQPVVDARDEGFLVGALLRPGDQVRLARENRRDERGDLAGKELEVGRIEDEDAPTGGQAGGAQRLGDALPGAVARDAQEL